MTWDDWSDLKLSTMVALVCGKEVHKGISNDKVVIGVTGGMHGNYDLVYFSINNPADMWPIIFDSEIAIIPPVSNGTNGWKAERFYSQNFGKIIDAIDFNPLRAAAIVFLMIKGVKPDERI